MKYDPATGTRRVLAGAMSALLILPMALPAGAATLAPVCDETFYATLDYYGAPMDSSVVKTYRTYGAASITDYGDYEQIINLTDERTASVNDGSVTFDLSGDVPDKFYFEGKTAKPLEEFPWALSLSYTLNGVPARAEELAGQTGVVEITLDAVPNPAASEYSRNNLVLTAMSMFNGDDILSLEAPGAQIQLVGNLYCVLYMVMPGEEQHFTIRVGSDDFSYAGMTLLAVPATLEQLSQVADLREAKEKAEDSYHAIQDSMDVILNSLDGMSGSLNTAASGLDQLNKARGTISDGKGSVYDSLDIALDAAGPLTESMAPMADHLAAAQQALTDTTALLNEMNTNVQGLKPEVENTGKILKSLQSDLDSLSKLADDLEDYPSRARSLARSLSSDFDKLGSSISKLEGTLNSTRSQLSGMNSDLAGVQGGSEVTINGKTIGEIETLVRQANQLRAAYEGSDTFEVITFDQFIAAYLISQGTESDAAAAQAAALAGLWTQAQSPSFQAQLEQAKELNTKLDKLGMSVDELKELVGTVDSSVSPILKQLADLCTALNSKNLSGDLSNLSDLMADLMSDIDDQGGTLSSAADTLKSAAELGQRISGNADTALDQLQSLTDIMNTYEPETHQALEDAKTFADSASTSISALVDAARTTESLLKSSGSSLDAGTQKALSGLSAALRQSTKGLGQTDTIRNAKTTIDALITDEWDSHAGGDNNLLLMDAGASPVSLTDPRNQGTASIQYLIRTQEIKVSEADAQIQAAALQKDNGTFWSRVADMFRDFWTFLTGWTHRG